MAFDDAPSPLTTAQQAHRLCDTHKHANFTETFVLFSQLTQVAHNQYCLLEDSITAHTHM
jgi:hypothetical protein